LKYNPAWTGGRMKGCPGFGKDIKGCAKRKI